MHTANQPPNPLPAVLRTSSATWSPGTLDGPLDATFDGTFDESELTTPRATEPSAAPIATWNLPAVTVMTMTKPYASAHLPRTAMVASKASPHDGDSSERGQRT